MPHFSTARSVSPPLPWTSTLEHSKWIISDLALELQDPQPSRPVVRMLPYPWPLVFGGITTICPGCGARRDWLLISIGHEIQVRCRCAAQWPEPDLNRSDFDALYSHTERLWSSPEEAARGLGFDGLFAGTHLAS
jgi:hypothetical protein